MKYMVVDDDDDMVVGGSDSLIGVCRALAKACETDRQWPVFRELIEGWQDPSPPLVVVIIEDQPKFYRIEGGGDVEAVDPRG